MANKNHSYNGEELTGNISGFAEYSTSRIVSDAKPRPVLSPADINAEITTLRRFLSVPELEKALKLLTNHIGNLDNPHRNDLSQFTEQVIDVLYQYYVDNGGTGSRGYFASLLFKVLHVATVEDMEAGTDETALLCIAGVRQLLHQHEIDPEAHSELISQILPGKPISAKPACAIFSNIGIATSNCVNPDSTVPYTYVDVDRVVKVADSVHTLPVDYTYNVPLLPCFGERTNEISSSTDFSKCTKLNVNTTVATVYDPMKTTAATAIVSTDTADYVHSLKYSNVIIDDEENKTFSIYVKAGSCKYFMMSYADLTADTVKVRAIFDLTTNEVFLMNHMDRYTSEITQLANGWYRCSLSMYHKYGQMDDMEFTFFKEKDSKLQNFACATTENEILGYLWGVQYEKGNNVSPYIATNGSILTRKPIPIVIGSVYGSGQPFTVSASFRNTGNCASNSTRPLLTGITTDAYDLVTRQDGKTYRYEITPEQFANVINKSDDVTMEVIHRALGLVEFNQWQILNVQNISTHTLIRETICAKQNSRYMNVAYSISNDDVVTAYNSDTYTEEANSALSNYTEDTTTGRPWMCHYVLVGCDTYGRYAETYMYKTIAYNTGATEEQCLFLNGEEIHE